MRKKIKESLLTKDLQEIKDKYSKSNNAIPYNELVYILGKVKNRTFLQKQFTKAYNNAKNYGLLDKYFPVKHIVWTKENVKEKAGEFTCKSEFKQYAHGAWKFAKENGMLDDLYPTDIYLTSHASYVIYSYEDVSNKVVYVGLTKRIKTRHIEHQSLSKSGKYDTVMSYFTSINKQLPPYKILEDGLSKESAQIREDFWKRKYQADGWKTLNIAKTGLGSSATGGPGYKWTEEKVQQLIAKYGDTPELRKRFPHAVQLALKCGLLNYKRKKPDIRGITHYNRNELIELGSSYSTMNQFKKFRKIAYAQAKEMNLLNIINDIIINKERKPRCIIWTKDLIKKEIQKYSSRNEFHDKSYSAFRWAKSHGWLDELIPCKTRKIVYSDEDLINMMRNYKSYTQFKKDKPTAAKQAKERKLTDKYLPIQTKYSNKKG